MNLVLKHQVLIFKKQQMILLPLTYNGNKNLSTYISHDIHPMKIVYFGALKLVDKSSG